MMMVVGGDQGEFVLLDTRVYGVCVCVKGVNCNILFVFAETKKKIHPLMNNETQTDTCDCSDAGRYLHHRFSFRKGDHHHHHVVVNSSSGGGVNGGNGQQQGSGGCGGGGDEVEV